jgi:hypothetical protein
VINWYATSDDAAHALQVLIAAKGVTENDRVGFGYFSYGRVGFGTTASL